MAWNFWSINCYIFALEFLINRCIHDLVFQRIGTIIVPIFGLSVNALLLTLKRDLDQEDLVFD